MQKEEAELEKLREKERIRSGKELLEAKRKEDDLKLKRNLELRRIEKEEEQRARDKIRVKLGQCIVSLQISISSQRCQEWNCPSNWLCIAQEGFLSLCVSPAAYHCVNMRRKHLDLCQTLLPGIDISIFQAQIRDLRCFSHHCCLSMSLYRRLQAFMLSAFIFYVGPEEDFPNTGHHPHTMHMEGFQPSAFPHTLFQEINP